MRNTRNFGGKRPLSYFPGYSILVMSSLDFKDDDEAQGFIEYVLPLYADELKIRIERSKMGDEDRSFIKGLASKFRYFTHSSKFFLAPLLRQEEITKLSKLELGSLKPGSINNTRFFTNFHTAFHATLESRLETYRRKN